MLALDARNISMQFNNFDLKNINLNISLGEIVSIVGPNGSGKSSLLKIITNQYHANEGDIFIAGIKNTDFLIKQKVGIVYDDIPFPKHWTAIDIDKWLGPFYSEWSSDLFFSYLNEFKVDNEKTVDTLSRGMKTKLMLAHAISHNAQLLILDEPTSGLDPTARKVLLSSLKKYVSDKQHSVLFTTHISTDVTAVADRMSLMIDGSLLLTEKVCNLNKYRLVKCQKQTDINASGDDMIPIKTNNTFWNILKNSQIEGENIQTSIDEIIELFEVDKRKQDI